MVTVRDLIGLSTDEILNRGIWIEGRQVRRVSKTGPEYHIVFGTGEILAAKGHSRIDSLSFPRQGSTDSRIRRYGQFGTSI